MYEDELDECNPYKYTEWLKYRDFKQRRGITVARYKSYGLAFKYVEMFKIRKCKSKNINKRRFYDFMCHKK